MKKKSDKDIRVILNQRVNWSHQLEVQDHFQAQVQFWKKDNLLKCQGDFQDFRWNEIESWFLSTEGMWMGEMIDSSSGSMRIKIGSRTSLSSGNTTGVDIDSRIGFELLNWNSGCHSSSSSISWNW